MQHSSQTQPQISGTAPLIQDNNAKEEKHPDTPLPSFKTSSNKATKDAPKVEPEAAKDAPKVESQAPKVAPKVEPEETKEAPRVQPGETKEAPKQDLVEMKQHKKASAAEKKGFARAIMGKGKIFYPGTFNQQKNLYDETNDPTFEGAQFELSEVEDHRRCEECWRLREECL